jgi:hypothetical protein
MSTIFVDNEKSTFISEEKYTGMYFLLNYRLIKNSSCKHRHHRHLGPWFFFSIVSIKCASTTYMNPFDMLRCEINAFMNYAPFS